MENIEKKAYEPKLGDANRYSNAMGLNPSFAEHINQEALYVVQNAESVLEKIKQNPEMKNFHDSKCGSQYMGEWLRDQKSHILQKIYGVAQLDGLKGVPSEVENFVKDVYKTVEM